MDTEVTGRVPLKGQLQPRNPSTRDEAPIQDVDVPDSRLRGDPLQVYQSYLKRLSVRTKGVVRYRNNCTDGSSLFIGVGRSLGTPTTTERHGGSLFVGYDPRGQNKIR